MPWHDECATDGIDEEDVIRWDLGERTFAIYYGTDRKFYCSDGLRTHEQVHLSDGLVMDNEIECPKHNGLFDCRMGKALRAPVCEHLGTYETILEGGRALVRIE